MDELDQIALEAGGMEAEAQAKQDELLDPAPTVDPAEAWAALPKMFGALLQIAMPELAGVYNDQACYQWGGAMQAMAEKHEWDAAATMSLWAPEIGLVFASVPLVIPTVQAIRARRAEAANNAPKSTLDTGATAGGQPAPAGEGAPAQGGGFVDPD